MYALQSIVHNFRAAMLRNLISRNVSKAAGVISRKAGSESNLPASAKVFLTRIPGKPVVTYSRAELLEGYSNVFKRANKAEREIGLKVVVAFFLIPHLVYYIGFESIYIPYFHKKHVNYGH